MITKEFAKECVSAAIDFSQRRLWQRFGNHDLLLFDVPSEDEILTGAIMGAAGEEYGIMLLRGPAGLVDFERILTGQGTNQFHLPDSTMLSMSIARQDEIEGPFRTVLDAAGHKGRTGPLFVVKELGSLARAPRKKELTSFLYVFRGLLTADDLGQLEPMGSHETRILPRLRVKGDARAPQVRIELVSVDADGVQNRHEISVPPELASLPRLDICYLVGFQVTPARITNDTREMRALVVFDAEDAILPVVKVVAGFDLEQVATHLFSVFLGKASSELPGLPRQIVFSNHALYQALHSGLQDLDVACSYEADIPALDEFVEALVEEAWSAGPVDSRDLLPEADDLEGWKDVDLHVSELLWVSSTKQAMASSKAWRRYFGASQQSQALEIDFDGRVQMHLISYLEWYALRFRSTPKSKTPAERLLQGRLPPAERMVLEARSAAEPSVYRIKDVSPGESLEVVDLLSGKEYRLFDKSFSMNAKTDMRIIARVYPAGKFHFASLAGPVLSIFDLEPALAFLEDVVGLELHNDGIAKAEHLLGRLWIWSENRAATSHLEIRNRDGHRILWHSASFSVRDTEAFEEALAEREDIGRLEAENCWCWLGVEEPHGGRRDLGRLTLYGDELLLEVNSRERFEEARAFLLAMPGVVFESVTETQLDPMALDDRPLDDRLPSREEPPELSEEERQAVQQMIRQQCFGWLDESVPALGGQTPRAACQSLEGRRKVARMIRSYPDPGGIPGIQIPRQEMLRELGLEQG